MEQVDAATALVVKPARSAEVSVTIALDVLSAGLFDHGATAVTQTPDGDLLAGFEKRTDAEAARTALSSTYEHLISSVERVDDADHDWVSSQRGGFTPTKVGPWHIRTPWSIPPDDIAPEFDIQIDPARAFGHGAHPSTKLALTLLFRHLGPRHMVWDVGTGTGVLAIIAARSGCDVAAIDNDAVAVQTAAANIDLNSNGRFEAVRSRITVIHGGLDRVQPRPRDIVIANLTIGVQRQLTNHLQGVETILLSGLLSHQIDQVTALYPDHTATQMSSIGEWGAVELTKCDPSPEGTSS